MPNGSKTTYKCLIVDDEPMARDVVRRYIEKIPTLQLIGECGNAIDATVFLQNESTDIIFLDIRMPYLSGTEFIKSLHQVPKVIITTAFKEYAIDGFELDVVDYLLKPIRFERFLRAVNKALSPRSNEEILPKEEQTIKKQSSGFIYLKADRKMIKLMLQDILYIESARDYLKIFTKSGSILTRQTISSIEAMLSESEFIRIHRSFIVSINKVSSFTHESVEIEKKQLPIGKYYLNNFLKLQE